MTFTLKINNAIETDSGSYTCTIIAVTFKHKIREELNEDLLDIFQFIKDEHERIPDVDRPRYRHQQDQVRNPIDGHAGARVGNDYTHGHHNRRSFNHRGSGGEVVYDTDWDNRAGRWTEFCNRQWFILTIQSV